MSSPNFLDWLSGQTVAAWIVAACSIAGLMITLFIKKRPKQVVCREIAKTSLVRIKKTAKEKVAILFNDKPVENLAQLETDVYNTGTEVIENILLTFKYPEGTRILDVAPNDIEAEVKDHQIQVKIPFLNPLRQHKHRLKVAVVVDGTVDNVQVVGEGKGWSTRRIALPTERQLFFKYALAMSLLSGILVSIFPVARMMNVGLYEFSIRAILIGLPYLVAIGLIIVWSIRSIFLPMFRIGGIERQ